MKVLLLGATGLLGHNVLLRLLDEGHRVVALVRNRGSLHLGRADYEVVESRTIVDAQVLKSAAAGCDAVVNCAGVTDMSLLHREDYTAVNSTLCTLLIEVMAELGIRRLVHVSTVNTIGYGTADSPANESAPMQPPFEGSYYADSKLEGETAVMEGRKRYPELEAVVVNPGYMLGPYDVKPSSGRMLLAAYRRPWMVAPRGGKAFVHVADVAQAVVNALRRGEPGNRYIAVNSRACMSIKELYELQAQVCGYRQRVLTVPDGWLLAAGKVGDVLRKMGVKTELSSHNVRQLMVREYYDNRRAMEQLGMPETPIAKAIEEFHQWRGTSG